jgi:hypothetical protein
VSLLDEIPGYREAVQRESFVRDSAFQPVTESLCGFEVRQMAFRDYLALRLIGSPFLVGGEPKPQDVRAFLWRMSPTYHTGHGSWWARQRIMRRCRAMLPPAHPMIPTTRAANRWARRALKAVALQGELLISIRTYMADTMQDWPSGGGAGGIAFFSDGVVIVGMVAREYHWTQDQILGCPMKLLLQYLKEIKQAHGCRVMRNPSDSVTAQYLNEQNRN